MVYNSMQLLRNAIRYEEKLISSLGQKSEEIGTSWGFPGVTKEEVVGKLKKLEGDSLHHEEILNYWIEEINAGTPI